MNFIYTFDIFSRKPRHKIDGNSRIRNIYISIIFNSKLKEIRVCNDAGRICRPLLIVEKQKLLLKRRHIEQLKSSF